jgi:DNA-binding IclR family transcriptional regulator
MAAASENGTYQNIARASAALTALAGSGNTGLRLTDVANATGMSKTAAHRCLAGLVAYGMAAFDAESSRYFLGDQILAWAGMAEERFELASRIKPYLGRLADELHDTVYFSVRRGDEAVCYGRSVGDFPVKTLTLRVGDHRPLGVGSGSLAILAFVPDEEIERVMREHASTRAEFPLTDELLRTKIEEARVAGYTHMEGYLVQRIQGMRGVGVPVRDRSGRCVASFSLAAIAERLEQPRLTEVATRLRREAGIVADELSELLAEL